MGNTFGRAFRVTSFGESHGAAVGVVVDGCPARLPLPLAAIQAELDRRRPGQSALTSSRQEPDRAQLLSGVSPEGETLGTPIAIWVANADARPADYAPATGRFRPSHADFAYQAKYGIRSAHGGGRASARETVGRVAAGAVAQRLLAALHGIRIVAYVAQVHNLTAPIPDLEALTRAQVDASLVRCPDPVTSAAMAEQIAAARDAGDSLGGVIGAVALGVPAGWGEPVFDKLEADLAKAMLSLPACRGFEVGSGFAGAASTGSAHNDAFYREAATGRIRTRTNNSGGIQGGISNGEAILLRAAFKPTATIQRLQETVTDTGEATHLAARGRHDPCVLPRAVPIVEAMIALVLADHCLRQRGQNGGPTGF